MDNSNQPYSQPPIITPKPRRRKKYLPKPVMSQEDKQRYVNLFERNICVDTPKPRPAKTKLNSNNNTQRWGNQYQYKNKKITLKTKNIDNIDEISPLNIGLTAKTNIYKNNNILYLLYIVFVIKYHYNILFI